MLYYGKSSIQTNTNIVTAYTHKHTITNTARRQSQALGYALLSKYYRCSAPRNGAPSHPISARSMHHSRGVEQNVSETDMRTGSVYPKAANTQSGSILNKRIYERQSRELHIAMVQFTPRQKYNFLMSNLVP